MLISSNIWDGFDTLLDQYLFHLGDKFMYKNNCIAHGPFCSTFNTIQTFLQLTNFSVIPTSTTIPFMSLFDKQKLQILEFIPHHLHTKMFFLEHCKKFQLQNKN